MYDTIIIGAGMSGLAAGIRLAHFDRHVCILERHDRIGGLNWFYRQRGRDYDVGLHAVTNYTPKGTRRGPLARMLRQLRLAWDELALAPQVGSAIAFPGVTLKFSNNFELLESEVARHFPRQKDNFRRMVAELTDYDQLGSSDTGRSAREVVGRCIDDELLVEMILCPLLLYGGARERDMDYGQFSIMFRAIFLEGLARPLAGVRLILKKLATLKSREAFAYRRGIKDQLRLLVEQLKQDMETHDQTIKNWGGREKLAGMEIIESETDLDGLNVPFEKLIATTEELVS